jgi:hypothetical protein
VQKLFNFMEYHLSILSLSCWAARVLLRKALPIHVASRVFLAISYTNFRVSGLILRSLIHFELMLVQDDRHGSSFSFLQADNLFSQKHLLKRLGIFHHMFLVTLSHSIAVWIHIWILYSVPLGLYICFCASTMLFLLLLLYNIV